MHVGYDVNNRVYCIDEGIRVAETDEKCPPVAACNDEPFIKSLQLESCDNIPESVLHKATDSVEVVETLANSPHGMY